MRSRLVNRLSKAKEKFNRSPSKGSTTSDATQLPSKPTTQPPTGAADPGEAATLNSKTHEPPPSKPSIWQVAYDSLADAEKEILVDACPHFQFAGSTGAIELSCSAETLAEEVSNNVQLAEKERSAHQKTFKKGFSTAVRLLNDSKDAIGAITSSNPYAAAAWTTTSFILPLLLRPGEANEEAVELLGHVVHLIVVYRWSERTYGDNEDFREKLVQLYTKILKIQIDLFQYFSRDSALHRYGDSLLHISKWEDHLVEINKIDKQSVELSERLRDNANSNWRSTQEAQHNSMSKILDGIHEELKRAAVSKILRELDVYQYSRTQIPKKVHGTCEWFLRHPDFLAWRDHRNSRLLWLSADPGCGKSVLSNSLLECDARVLSNSQEERIVCYFFFKDGNESQMDAARAIGALIHQLILQAPPLRDHLVELEGRGDTSFRNFDLIWRLFTRLLEDKCLENKEVICVIDALDECRQESRVILIKALVEHFEHTTKRSTKIAAFKVIVTSRPYIDIEQDFSHLIEMMPQIRLSGEQESQSIEQEILLVIAHMAKDIGKRTTLGSSGAALIRDKLESMGNKTYLWLHLVSEYLQYSDIGRRTPRIFFNREELEETLEEVPTGLYEAYEDLIQRSPRRKGTQTLLQILLAARRPLTVAEAVCALGIAMDDKIDSYADLNIAGYISSPEDDAKRFTFLKNLCGLLITISDNHVHLLHQTVREFLISDTEGGTTAEVPMPSKNGRSRWAHSFNRQDSHLTTLKVCLRLLGFRGLREQVQEGLRPPSLPMDVFLKGGVSPLEIAEFFISHETGYLFPMLEYAYENTLYHVQVADPKVPAEIWDNICDEVFEDKVFADVLPLESRKIESSTIGLYEEIRCTIPNCKDLDGYKTIWLKSPYASEFMIINQLYNGLRWSLGHEKAQKLGIWSLLWPLVVAVLNSDLQAATLLLDETYSLEEISGLTAAETPPSQNPAYLSEHSLLYNPLCISLKNGSHEMSKKLMRSSKIWIHLLDSELGSCLDAVSSCEERADVELCTGILSHLLNCDCSERERATMKMYPVLFCAGHDIIFGREPFESKLWLIKPFQEALRLNNHIIVGLLLMLESLRTYTYPFGTRCGTTALTNYLFEYPWMTFLDISKSVHERKYGLEKRLETLKMLLTSADPNQVCVNYLDQLDLPLSSALITDNFEVAEVLCESGANVNGTYPFNQSNMAVTPLVLLACDGGVTGHQVEFLLDRKAEVDRPGLFISMWKNSSRLYCGTPLQTASYEHNTDMIKALVPKGASFAPCSGSTVGNALQAAFLSMFRGGFNDRAHESSRLILSEVTDSSSADPRHLTPLHLVCMMRRNAENVKKVLDRGAAIEAVSDQYPTFGTVLHAAAAFGSFETVKILLKKGADPNASGGLFGSPLQAAARSGNIGKVKALVRAGARVNALGGRWGTALKAACKGAHHADDLKMVQYLVKHGATIDSDEDDCCPFSALEILENCELRYKEALSVNYELFKKHPPSGEAAEIKRGQNEEADGLVRDSDDGADEVLYDPDSRNDGTSHESIKMVEGRLFTFLRRKGAKSPRLDFTVRGEEEEADAIEISHRDSFQPKDGSETDLVDGLTSRLPRHPAQKREGMNRSKPFSGDITAFMCDEKSDRAASIPENSDVDSNVSTWNKNFAGAADFKSMLSRSQGYYDEETGGLCFDLRVQSKSMMDT